MTDDIEIPDVEAIPDDAEDAPEAPPTDPIPVEDQEADS